MAADDYRRGNGVEQPRHALAGREPSEYVAVVARRRMAKKDVAKSVDSDRCRQWPGQQFAPAIGVEPVGRPRDRLAILRRHFVDRSAGHLCEDDAIAVAVDETHRKL